LNQTLRAQSGKLEDQLKVQIVELQDTIVNQDLDIRRIQELNRTLRAQSGQLEDQLRLASNQYELGRAQFAVFQPEAEQRQAELAQRNLELQTQVAQIQQQRVEEREILLTRIKQIEQTSEARVEELTGQVDRQNEVLEGVNRLNLLRVDNALPVAPGRLSVMEILRKHGRAPQNGAP
jgi:hypothetical protein